MISCEGLLQYLSKDELSQLIEGIRAVLKKHGGAWYTDDYCINCEELTCTALGTEDAAQRYNEARKHSMGSSNIFNLTSGISTMEQLVVILEENGMRVEKIPYVAPKQSFNMMKAFSPEIGAQLLELLQGYAMLKITPDTSYTAAPAIEGAREIENLQLRYTVSNNTLYIDVAGRIDTISAPALLECFETNKESVSRLQIDFSDLQYISSAGLRVLMIAYKALGKGNVAIRGMSPVVRNIFETTGFVEFFDLS